VTLADAFTAHDEAMNYGGREGVSNLHLIQSAIARPYSGYHRPIARKAAALLNSMVNNHGFVDGNKRTAWLTVEILIYRSGFRLDTAPDDRIDDLVVDVASGKTGFDDLTAWFGARLSKASAHP